MAPTKRDPNKTARNKTIDRMQHELRTMVDTVMYEIDRDSELSVNAYIGSKADDFLDLKNDVIRTPEEYVSKWLQGLDEGYKAGKGNRFRDMHDRLKDPANSTFRKYCELFLKRSFLKHYNELSKVRPGDEEAHIWFGLNDADFGLFVAPRFNPMSGNWENDKSEIRAFTETYWTIGHLLKTGLCIPKIDRKRQFRSVEEYLDFFYDQLRLTKSIYQVAVAERYIDFVKASSNPLQVPLLIPEVRLQEGLKHGHRLDFLVINPYTMDKIGIELSPWSSHGRISGKHKTLKAINEEAKANFEAEIRKVKSYYKKYGIYTFIYPDSELADLDSLFKEIENHLNPTAPPEQLSLHLVQDYFLSI